jgi:hypothetical protein
MAKSFLSHKRGLSTVVITVILIALGMMAVLMVWGFISNMIKDQIGENQACYGNYDKVQINGEYTCYEGSGTAYSLRFSLMVGDVKIEKVLVSVSSESVVETYTITAENETIEGLSMYPSGSSLIALPARNAGLTYNAAGFTSKIDSIKIAPVISGTVCEVSDILTEVERCM